MYEDFMADFVRVHFCHEGGQRVQNALQENKRHVRVKDTGFQKFD